MDGIRRYAGIDWASRAPCGLRHRRAGRRSSGFEVEHTEAGPAGARSGGCKAGVDGVAIERPDGPVIDALLEAGLRVVVIASRHVKALRTRHGLAGNKDDRADAFVLADALRTDGHRLRPLQPDAPETVALRATVRARKDLVQTRVAPRPAAGAPTSTLVFPGAVGLFADLDSPIAQAFLLRFPSAERAAWLSPRRMAAWLAAQGYCGRTHRRRAACPARGGTRGADRRRGRGDGRGDARPRPGASPRSATRSTRSRRASREQLALHPDGAIFTQPAPLGPASGRRPCWPRSATAGSASRRPSRWPASPGAAPSTRQSGQHRAVTFRFACDKKLRDALIDFAEDSRFANPWAADVYRRATSRGKTHPHAGRILARAWVDVIWRCWQDRVPYDPARHRALQRVRPREGGLT